MQSHGHSERRTKDKDSNVKYKIKGHVAGGGEREQWALVVSHHKKAPPLLRNLMSEKICPNPDITNSITASFVLFHVFFFELPFI